MPRLKSEAIVRAQCDAGLAAYLAEPHRKDFNSATGTGVALGTVIAGGLWGISKVLNEKFGIIEYAFIFGTALLSSIISSVMTWDKADADHEKDFDTVCQSIEDTTEEEDATEDEDANDEEISEAEENYLPTKIMM